ncbi:MAG: 30S ribosomal protein S7 [Kiritimatiellia bacterium]|jgi:small subunit ribosomal protein S7|nr:30S ribosomal protein S7 [Kiritimatiellia bacterium]MDP6631610.1 30S ribosomal protein S7 [Kiritimatiellia bacterium]MDP6810209.1 30S ribosomal protein S7 [Kiritimatiellia bacterium]MDP7022885.1 30S ribosomal protein S7 [Kiritimatiellia bacterium]
MARRRKAEKRTLAPDPTYNSELVAKVINFTMRGGKKSTAERIVYGALNFISEKMSEEPIEVLIKAIDNMKPRVEVKSRRVGGSTYQVPVEISRDRQLALALRWLLAAAKGRRGVAMGQAMAMELMDAFNGQGSVIRKRDDTHRMAQANKAFAHYAW